MKGMSGPRDAAGRDRLVGVTEGIDERTRVVAHNAARALTFGVRVLRFPSLIVVAAPLPFIAVIVILSVIADGPAGIVGLAAALLMLVVSAVAVGRRHRLLAAVEDSERLASELAIMISMSDKVGETRTTLAQIVGGGWQVLSRLKGLWSAANMTSRWIEEVGDLRCARYFAPPKIGTTVLITWASLWLIPISAIAALFVAIGTIAGSL